MPPRHHLSKEERIARDLSVQHHDMRARRRSLQLVRDKSVPTSCSSLESLPMSQDKPASSSNSERSENVYAVTTRPRTPRQRPTEHEVSSSAPSLTRSRGLTLDPEVFRGHTSVGTDHIGARCSGGGHVLVSWLRCLDVRCACRLGCGDSRCQICVSAMKTAPSGSNLAELALAGLQIRHRTRGRRYGPVSAQGEPTSSSGSERSLGRGLKSRLPRTKGTIFRCGQTALVEEPNATRLYPAQLPPSDSAVSSQQSSRRPSFTSSQISVEDLPFGHMRISDTGRRS